MQPNFFKRTYEYLRTHKKTSIFILIVLLIIAYYSYKFLTRPSTAPTYVLGTVTQGTVVASTTGTGQVAANHELALKPQASGNVVYVAKKAGDSVAAGDVIAELDTTIPEKAVRDAEANLQSAQLSLQILEEPATQLSVLQAQDAVTQAQATLATDYTNGSTNISSAFLDLPNIMTGLNGVVYGTTDSPSGSGQANVDFYSDTAQQFEDSSNTGEAAQYAQAVKSSFAAAQTAYNQNFADYKNESASADTATISKLITETYTTSNLIAESVKDMSDLVHYYQDTLTNSGRTPITKSNTDLSSLNGYTSLVNGHITDLLSSQDSITADEASVPEKTAALTQLQAGADPLNIQSAQLNVTKAQNALQDAKDNLQDYYITAPFAGTLADVDVKVGDPADSSTLIATLIDTNQVVDIPLNEVDVSAIKLGDKATLTFDAVPDLTLTGKVASIDTIGTVTQGVVNYTVTISFDTVDPRVLSGMSTTASIITQVDADVLTVPTSAVKTSANGSYVLAFTAATPATTDATGSATAQSVVSSTPPEQIPVTVGISDDTNTEIVSGLTEGQQIVVKTIAATTTAAKTTTAPSLLSGVTGGRGGAGGAVRAAAPAIRPAGN